jgi:methylated-DNA-[protein]-cysteine S-methyltransferase
VNKITDFQKKVYFAVSQIPYGKVSTYKLIAEFINCRSYRAVGSALKKNPFAPEIPCHRVIASDLTIGGYLGKKSGKEIQVKKNLLASEGVIFNNNTLLHFEMVFNFNENQ